MHNKLAAYLIKHSRRPQPRQKVAEALRHAVEIRSVQQPDSKQSEAWHEAVELLKRVHLRMPKY